MATVTWDILVARYAVQSSTGNARQSGNRGAGFFSKHDAGSVDICGAGQSGSLAEGKPGKPGKPGKHGKPGKPETPSPVIVKMPCLLAENWTT